MLRTFREPHTGDDGVRRTDDEHDQIVRGVMRQLEMSSDIPAICLTLAFMALLMFGGYFAWTRLDPAMETQPAFGVPVSAENMHLQ